MGTFHDDKSPLHGITVVVDTADGGLWVGRCHDENSQRVILLDADVHRSSKSRPSDTRGKGQTEGETERQGGSPSGGKSREEWLSAAVRFGVWARHKSVVIAREDVVSLRRLGDVEALTREA